MPAEAQSKYDQRLVFVLKTAAAIFAEKGYHSTSIRDIARATKMSLSGLYYYFKSKEELLFLIQDYCFSTVIDDCRRLLEGVTDPVHRPKRRNDSAPFILLSSFVLRHVSWAS